MIRITAISKADMDCGNGRLRHWADIEKERDQLRIEAHKEANTTLTQRGHKMIPWSNVNTAHCKDCGRQAKITNILGRDHAEFNGPAFCNPCDDTETYSSRDRWHWEFNAQME